MQYSVVSYKTVRENSDFRIDADYYHPEKMKSLIILRKNADIVLGDFVLSVKKNELPKDSGIEIYDTGAASSHILTKNFAQTEVRISLKRKAKSGDIIISRLRPYLKQIAYIPNFINKAYLTTEFFVLRSKDQDSISFLMPFLLTEFVQKILFWCQGGTQHPRFQEYDLLNLPIPKNIFTLKKLLNRLVFKCCRLFRESESLYSQAEQLLLSELGLLDWKPKHELAFVKNYSDTKQAERMDAEYFQPKYEEIIEAVKQYKGGFVILGDVAKTKRGSLIPDSFYDEQKGVPYIRGADISSGFLNNDKLVYINNSFHSKSETRVKKYDIVFALIGTVGSTALVSEDFDEAFISNNLGKITTKNYNPVVLQILFHSIIGKLYFEKEQTQTAQPKISDSDIHKFILPKLEEIIEKEIEQKYIKSQKMKKLSKSLLEIAKRGVEIAIEKDEQEAEKWIEEALEKENIKL